MSVFKHAARALSHSLNRTAGDRVLYNRGTTTVIVDAVKGQSEFEEQDASGALLQFKSTDWLIDANDLKAVGISLPPRRGDKIIETLNGETVIYSVLPDSSLQPYRYSDSHHQRIRIHSKETGV